MDGYVTNLEHDTERNTDFRRVLYTGPNTQLVLMTLRPREEIGLETHLDHDQFIRVEQGEGLVRLNDREHDVHSGSAVVVPAGVPHNVRNTSATALLRLYTLYSPPEHPEGTVHRTKQDALAAEEKTREAALAGLLAPGSLAPDFSLRDAAGRDVTLRQHRGSAVILAFYPGDWSPVCGDQLALYNELVPDFRDMGAELIGISVDSTWSHAAFADNRKLRFPLLSDFEPKGATARQYNAYRAHEGVTERALFVLDREGKVNWSYLAPIDVNPGADGIVGALAKLKSSVEEPRRLQQAMGPREAEARP